MQKILIISNYYPPETGAASNRIATLVQGLQEIGWNVSVLCPLPNYPNGKVFSQYQGKIRDKRIENGICVNRTWVYPSNSKNKIVRLISMLSFSFSMSLFLLFSKIPNRVIIQSPPLFVAFFAVLICRLKGKKVILNVSDLWPLAGKELGVMNDGFGYKMLQRIEKFNYSKSHLILGQSQEICEHVTKLVSTKTILYRNYPKFSLQQDFLENSSDKIHIVYAGLLGVAQGIVELCENINLPQNVILDIYGNGAEKEELIQVLEQKKLKNIFYHGELTRSELHKVLVEKADYAIVPLVNRIYGSVPSKIFEMANIGLPVIYMGGGEGGDIVSEYRLGSVIEPKDYRGLNDLIRKLEKTSIVQKNEITEVALKHFSFDKQLERVNNQINLLN